MITKYVIKFLSNALIPKAEGGAEAIVFINDTYMPELFDAVKNVSIGHANKKALIFKFIGMLIKIGYAFMW